MRVEQPTFSAGEVSPQIAARIDTDKRQAALRLARNVIGLREGGVRNRPGTLLVGATRNSTGVVRLIPFQFSATQAHCLELVKNRLRVIEKGRYVTTPPKPVSGVEVVPVESVTGLRLHIVGHGLAPGQHVQLRGLSGLTDADGLSGVNGRTFRVADPNTLDGDTTNDNDADHVTLMAMAGVHVDIGAGLTPYAGGGEAAGLVEVETPYDDADLAAISYEQSADVMYLAHPAYQLRKLSRTGAAEWTLQEVTFRTHVNPPQNVQAVTHPGSGTQNPHDEAYCVTSFSDVTGQESLVSSTQTIGSDLTLAGAYNTITWDAPDPHPENEPPTRYLIYKASAGLFGYIGSTVSGAVNVQGHVTFKDDNIDPDLGNGPPINAAPFTGTGSYPGAVGFYEQRLYAAGTDARPNGVWASRSGDFENMNYSRPLKADDALSFGISARQVNRVLHLVPMSDLLAFTSDTVFKISGAGGEAVSPASIAVKPQVHRGAANVRPVVVDDAVLYVTAKGSRLRNLGYQLQADGYQGTDLTVFSSHLFEHRSIIALAWVEHPHSAVFCATSDGKVLCMTWMPEQQVYGWSLLETDGQVETLCAVTEDGQDVLYLGVWRMRAGGGGGGYRYVERLADPFDASASVDWARTVFLDSAVTYSGVAADLFSGLEHLEGRTVNALADGHVVTGLTVAGGKVRLEQPASALVVGVPYVSTIQTLTPGSSQQPTQGRRQSIARATFRLRDTRGVKAGVDPDRLETLKPRLGAAWGDPADLVSGDVELAFDTAWAPDTGVIVRQDQPLPMTVLGVFADLQVGG